MQKNVIKHSEKNSAEYIKLENRLVLLAWLNSLLGYKTNRELLEDMKDVEEGFDSQGRSYIFHRLQSRGDKVKIPLSDLSRYDDNINTHLQTINARRPEPIKLLYFQYLSVLYADLFLDWFFNRRKEFIRTLNEFVKIRNASKSPGDVPDPRFEERDMEKLAFWMATGSGKTLVMHFNYYQFLHYNNKPLDNILLITPNEGLTNQHIEEMTLSGISCSRFDLNESGLGLTDGNSIRVIEITKLVQEKRGGGVSVPVEAFEGNNLIFVDEGHKGSGGEKWRKFRDSLSETGFTFEYSATFGQALTAAKKDTLTAEYGKAIVFDYSYRYFHGDGYGKDFHILNLREVTTEEKTETLVLGNLLSFYEQQRCFEEQNKQLRPYNIEKPLWVFVGSSVNAVYTENKQKCSDVLTVSRFLHHFIENKGNWAAETIKKIINGKTGLIDEEGEDVFTHKFEYLRSAHYDPDAIYADILKSIFHAQVGGALHISDIRGSAGELGLKVSGAEDYFGLIYIGDTSTFKSLVESDDAGIVIEEDVISESLFEEIKIPGTSINVLIGAKKFMEGWNSWRVSNMGLLNIGKTEGSEIIQLFGRGVRLRGLDFSLKRSSALDGEHPEHIRLLETLNIFAVRANYMAQFRDYLEREGVETCGDVELPLAIKPNNEFLGRGLVIPRIPSDRNFAEESDLVLKPDTGVQVSVDMSLKVQLLRSGEEGVTAVAMKAGQERPIPRTSMELIDWERLYLDLLEYKEKKGFFNLAINSNVHRQILTKSEPCRLYRLIADESVLEPRTFADRQLLQEAALSVLRKYIDKFYRVYQERWDSEHMVYNSLDTSDPNFQDYTVKIPRGQAELITAIQKLIEEGEKIYQEETGRLPRIYFDRHLYQPLLVERGGNVKSVPPGLNESEWYFVKDMRDYCRKEKDKSLALKEIFILRNLSRGKGIGFFDKRGFYPDFILWIKEGDNQRIVFVEPHGMLQTESYIHDEKAHLYEDIQKLAKSLSLSGRYKNIELDSFIISSTKYEDLRLRYDDGTWDKKRFAEKHILFRERNEEYEYITELFASGNKKP